MRGLLTAIILLWNLCLPLFVTGQDLNGQILSLSQPGCSPPFTGEVSVLGIDGVPPYLYTLDASIIQTNGSFSNLILGDHSIVIKDNLGSTYTLFFTIEINNQLEISVFDLSHVSCAGESIGEISVVAFSGVSPFSFSIDGGANFQSNGDFTNLSDGIYQIIGQDASGCLDTVSAEIVALSQINLLAINQENVDCFDGSNASIQLIGEFGSSPYQYSMDGVNFQSSEFFTNIDAGDHQFWVEDISACSDSISLNFTQPDSVSVENLSIINNSCFNGNDGEFTFDVSGGTAPYFYQLNGGLENNTPHFSGLSAGNYELIINDNSSCSYSYELVIDEPDSLIFTIVNSNSPLCYGESNGSIEFSCVGGIFPYEYAIDGNAWQDSALFTTLSAGVHSLQVRDQNACTSSFEYELFDQIELNLSLVTQVNVFCNISTNGSIEVLASGGFGSYSYSLNSEAFQPLPQFTGLSSGLYTIEVMDDNSCVTSLDIEITEINNLQIDDVQVVDAVCGIAPEGQITILASGGVIPYQYSIDGGALQASNLFLNVTPGIHTIELSTSDGCSVSTNGTLLSISNIGISVLDLIEPTCNGSNDGSIDLIATGGSAPFEYSIDFGINWQVNGNFAGLTDSTYLISIQDQFLCSFDTLITFTEQSNLLIDLLSISALICPGSNVGSIELNGINGTAPSTYSSDGINFNSTTLYSGLNTGDHSFWFQDGMGCITDTVFTIDAFETPSLVTDSLLAPTCSGMNDGVIQVSPGGSATPYQYAFDGGAFQASSYFNNLLAGTYTIVAEDYNLCQTSVDYTLVDVPVFQVSIDSVNDILCKGGEEGEIFYSFLGGQAPYYVSINSGSWQAASSSTGTLFAGTYNLSFKDENGCILSLIETIDEPLLDLVSEILSVVNVNCVSDSNGSVFGFASGGTFPYEFSIDAINYQGSGSFANLWTGNYTLYVKDGNGCISNEDFSILSTSSVSAVWASVILPTCETATNGFLSVAVFNGADPYSFQLNNGPSQLGGSFSNLGEDYYVVRVTDTLGCEVTIDTTLISNATLEIAVDSVINITCMADSSGEIFLNASGGIPTYSFFIDGNPLIGNSSNGFTSGIYQSWVVDAVGCSDSIEVAVQQESLLQGSIYSQQNIICNNGDLGSVTVNGITGSSPYFYSFEGGAFDSINTFSDLEEGNYTVIIQDATNCEAQVDVSIEMLTQIDLQVQYTIEPSCNALDDAIASFEVNGGIGPYLYSLDLSGLSIVSQYNDLYAGPHTVYAEDSQGCNDSISFTIDEPLAIDMIFDSIGLASCFGNNDAFIAISSINSAGAPSYNLLPNDITNSSGLFTDLTDGIYTLNVIDQNQCTKDSIVEIVSPSLMDLSISIVNSLDCYGDNNAIIDVIVNGGTAPFEYLIDSVSNGNNSFINNLSFGEYTVQVIDQNNCIDIETFSIDQPDSISINNIQINDISCFAADDGLAFINASGGSGELNYLLNTGVNSANGLFIDLLPGDYSLQIMDSLACNVQYEFSIIEPELLMIDTVLTQNLTCFGDSSGSFIVSVSGGSPGYTFDNLVLGTNNDGVYNNVNMGAYYINVIDQNSCSATQVISITEPDLLSLVTQAVVPPLCYNDSSATVLLQATGGNGNSMYGLSLDDLGFGSVFQNLYPGMTSFYVADSLGCSDSVDVYIPNSDSLSFDVAIQSVTCYGDSDGIVQLIGEGGSQGYSYSMDQNSWFDEGTFIDLPANDHLFYLMDSNGCIKDTIISLTQPDSLIAEIPSIYPVTCSDQNSGVINVSISGGTEPFESTLNTNSLSGSTVSFEGLSVGSYQIFISDVNGCETLLDTVLAEVENVSASIDSSSLDCFGDNNGVATVSYSGGSGAYLFLWNNSTEDESATTQANLVADVSYTVTVYDSLDLNCYTTAEVILTQPEQIEFELYPYSSSCDPNEISVNIELISGGVEPFLFSINDEQPVESSIFSNLTTVSTQFIVVDSDGCDENEWLTPENPNVIEAYFDVSDDVVPLGESEVLFTDLSGNSSHLEWNFGDGVVVSANAGEMAIGDNTVGPILEPEHSYMSFGEFTAQLNVSSEFGCEDSYERLIIVEEDHRVYVPNSFSPNNDGVNDLFEVKGSTIASYGFSMRIFDRSGNVIFESFDINIGWDGTGKNGVLLRPDVYVYMISYNSGDKFFEKNGSLTLLR